MRPGRCAPQHGSPILWCVLPFLGLAPLAGIVDGGQRGHCGVGVVAFGGREVVPAADAAELPASWQDTGSGVFAIAVAGLALGFGPLAGQPGHRLAVTAVLAGLGAFLVDVYLY